jgi:hypothetical protein
MVREAAGKSADGFRFLPEFSAATLIEGEKRQMTRNNQP